ncbi:growth/differentiation factor 10b [Megalops cyprinoides]|uniref:growth/differentiation factor 10b n=1 Tax=Megalops cyprinoides TaxID=118141 RepID=UPI0018652B5E|nr:growth/differentiation factor 10b [Megalops cyprinoides]
MAVIFLFLLHQLIFLNFALETAASEDAVRNGKDSNVFDVAVGQAGQTSDASAADRSALDMVSTHMFKLYEKYSRELNRPRDGNTVRSFKARADTAAQKDLYHFNLTSVTESEVILSATFQFLFDQRPRQRAWSCKRFRNPSCRLHQHQLPPVQILFRAASFNNTPGMLLGNVTFFPLRRGAWQSRDVSHVIKEARSTGELLITAEFDSGARYHRHQDRLPLSGLPYLLVYADDLAISEPNSVAATLQRYDPFPPGDDPTRSPNASPDTRVKRDAHTHDPIENNELPEVEYNTLKNHELWESAYLPLKPKHPLKDGAGRKDLGDGEGLSKPQVLRFDEKTMKNARRRQWSEPRACARRYLKVDFADIGWSEWILSPKSFDAYYCSGACGFPLPKVVRPSNHATIQSIVKAVGITPGIPEPCCVPDKMSSQSVLFLDEAKNVVLKIYPSMSVQTCSCR